MKYSEALDWVVTLINSNQEKTTESLVNSLHVAILMISKKDKKELSVKNRFIVKHAKDLVK